MIPNPSRLNGLCRVPEARKTLICPSNEFCWTVAPVIDVYVSFPLQPETSPLFLNPLSRRTTILANQRRLQRPMITGRRETQQSFGGRNAIAAQPQVPPSPRSLMTARCIEKKSAVSSARSMNVNSAYPLTQNEGIGGIGQTVVDQRQTTQNRANQRQGSRGTAPRGRRVSYYILGQLNRRGQIRALGCVVLSYLRAFQGASTDFVG